MAGGGGLVEFKKLLAKMQLDVEVSPPAFSYGALYTI